MSRSGEGGHPSTARRLASGDDARRWHGGGAARDVEVRVVRAAGRVRMVTTAMVAVADGSSIWRRRRSAWIPGRRLWKVAASEARAARDGIAWCCPCPRRICTGDLVAWSPDWFGSETVTSPRDHSRRLSWFGEVGWQPSSQAPVVAPTGSGRCAKGSHAGSVVADDRQI